MTENPYSPSGDSTSSQELAGNSAKSLFREGGQYCAAYLLGIISSIALTPVETTLGGAPLWLVYPILAPIGCLLFYFYLEGAYLPFGGKGTSYWWYFTIGLVPFALELAAYFLGSHRLRAWRPLWIGFPMGFVGTLGVYFTAAASI